MVFSPESALVSHDYLCFCLSVFLVLGAVWFACVLPSLMDPRRIVDFLVCSDFYLLWWSGDFLVLYMWNQKLAEDRFIFLFSCRDVQVVYFFLSEFFVVWILYEICPFNLSFLSSWNKVIYISFLQLFYRDIFINHKIHSFKVYNLAGIFCMLCYSFNVC